MRAQGVVTGKGKGDEQNDILEHGVWCAVLCCAVLCCAVLCCAVLCCAVLCCAVLYSLRLFPFLYLLFLSTSHCLVHMYTGDVQVSKASTPHEFITIGCLEAGTALVSLLTSLPHFTPLPSSHIAHT